MSVRTKKRPIKRAETVELRVVGPRNKRTSAFNALRKLGFVEVSESIAWREAFSQMENRDLPGVCLRGARKKEDMTQMELAKKTGIPQRHISEMENGKRPIGKKNATLLAKTLNVSYQIFL